MEDSAQDPEFVSRARAFGISLSKGDNSLVATNFAMAEDLNALGFVFLGLLLVSLADLKMAGTPMPATDEDTLQKLLSEIFNQDFGAFREYVEAEDVWTKLVEVLDEKNGAGWEVLETLFLARETIAKNQNSLEIVTARGLLSNRFFRKWSFLKEKREKERQNSMPYSIYRNLLYLVTYKIFSSTAYLYYFVLNWFYQYNYHP